MSGNPFANPTLFPGMQHFNVEFQPQINPAFRALTHTAIQLLLEVSCSSRLDLQEQKWGLGVLFKFVAF